jgi:predicted 3-demethylubiquinone-9 3-methyltransferase (glyoxalase superfamily)
MAKNIICLRYDDTAEDAAKFYAQTFPDSAAAKRAFDAMMKMKKIDIAAIDAARRGTARA